MSCNSDNDPREFTTWRSQGCKYVELGSLRLRTVRQAITLFPARSLQVHTMVAGAGLLGIGMARRSKCDGGVEGDASLRWLRRGHVGANLACVFSAMVVAGVEGVGG